MPLTPSKKVSCTAFAIFEPQHAYNGQLNGIKLDRVVQTRPTKLGSRLVAVQLTFEFDAAIFQQYLPEVVIQIDGQNKIIAPEVNVVEQPEPTDIPEEPTNG